MLLRWDDLHSFISCGYEEYVVYLSSELVGALKVIFSCDDSKNLETESSATISCHFLFDSWRQSENQKEIIACDQRQRNQTPGKAIFMLTLTLAERNKCLWLIKRLSTFIVFKAI